jgi:hypothetical protein
MDNAKFKREIYYSPSQKKTYLGKVPQGYEGEYGPHIRAQIVSFKYVNNMSIPKIGEFFRSVGIIISNSYVSQRLTKHLEVFHREKSEIYQASLESSEYQQIDDTASRVDGQNYVSYLNFMAPLASMNGPQEKIAHSEGCRPRKERKNPLRDNVSSFGGDMRMCFSL